MDIGSSNKNSQEEKKKIKIKVKKTDDNNLLKKEGKITFNGKQKTKNEINIKDSTSNNQDHNDEEANASYILSNIIPRNSSSNSFDTDSDKVSEELYEEKKDVPKYKLEEFRQFFAKNSPENNEYNEKLKEFINFLNNTEATLFNEENLVCLTDEEGNFVHLLTKLKKTGLIKNVKLDQDNKISFDLNDNFKGDIIFCGDLTSFKSDRLEGGNNIVIDIFNKLLEKVKQHNEKNTNTIKFVAVPGNHEFSRFQGGNDEVAMLKPENVITKLEGLKTLANIQLYYLTQNKGLDIKDDDYDSNIDFDVTISNLTKYIENIEKKIKEISPVPKDTFMQVSLKNDHFLDILKWENTALLSSLIFKHNNKKFRILHNYGLFLPKEYAKITSEEGMIPTEEPNFAKIKAITKDKQKNVFKDIYSIKPKTTIGVDNKKLIGKEVFSSNDIATFVGHEGQTLGTQDISKNSGIFANKKIVCLDCWFYEENSEIAHPSVAVMDKNNNLKFHSLYTNELFYEIQLESKDISITNNYVKEYKNNDKSQCVKKEQFKIKNNDEVRYKTKRIQDNNGIPTYKVFTTDTQKHNSTQNQVKKITIKNTENKKKTKNKKKPINDKITILTPIRTNKKPTIFNKKKCYLEAYDPYRTQKFTKDYRNINYDKTNQWKGHFKPNKRNMRFGDENRCGWMEGIVTNKDYQNIQKQCVQWHPNGYKKSGNKKPQANTKHTQNLHYRRK